MGNNMCKTETGMFSNEAQKFWKEIASKKDMGNEAKEKVKLNITISKAISSKTYKVSFSRAEQEDSPYQNEGETTELQPSGDLTVNFPTTFIMDYYFERQQFICFKVYSGGISNEIKTTLGNIMGSRKQFYQIELPNGEVFGVKGQGHAVQNDQYISFNVSISGKKAKEKVCFLIKNCGTQDTPSNTVLYKSEALVGEYINFSPILVPVFQLAPNGDHAENIVGIEVYDCKSKKKIGESTNCLSSFLGNDNSITLEGKATFTIKCQLKTKYNFLDYLRGGIQISLAIGIDFTGSNGSPKSPYSLHYPGESLNFYEKAIKSCGNIIAHYDREQLFPVYGYGAKPYHGSELSHCFHLNGESDPKIHTIDEVLKIYREKVKLMEFSGPTNFSPILQQFYQNVMEDKKKNNLIYNILMILTDGQITDMEKTIDELVKLSFEPTSIIIIGIGNESFSNMDILDADDNPLYDTKQRKAARDLVQFVPFLKFQNDGTKLAEEVLEEVPRQICEYYEMNNIEPGEPVMDTQ